MCTVVRRTGGDVPPPMVGCSITLVGSTVYVFGGRLVSTRTITSTLFALSLRTLEWELLWPPPPPSEESTASSPPPGPSPRYFHSAAGHGAKLVFFGGEGFPATSADPPSSSPYSSSSSALEALCDVFLWDTQSRKWEFPTTRARAGVTPPSPRFASLAVVAPGSGRMYVVGGQDVRNSRYVHEVAVLRLDGMVWERRERWEKSVGTYRSLVAVGAWGVRRSERVPGGRSLSRSVRAGEDATGGGGEREQPLLVFSNSDLKSTGGHTSIRRELDLITPTPPSRALTPTSIANTFASNPSLPPGLRFPLGSVIGRFLVVHGLDIRPSPHELDSTFAIWALDLGPDGATGLEELGRAEEAGDDALRWRRLDPGEALKTGSWSRAVALGNSLVVLGDANGDMVADYAKRQLNFSDVACIDVESFGIFQPPFAQLDVEEQTIGLEMLAAGDGCDYDVFSSDKTRFGCPRRLLEDRWPWFRARLDELVTASSAGDVDDSEVMMFRSASNDSTLNSPRKSQHGPGSGGIVHVAPNRLDLPLLADATLSLLQYFITLSLVTPTQHSAEVLSSLLAFTRTRSELVHLRTLVVHALHEGLDDKSISATSVYEAAVRGSCAALQIRAVRMIMSEVASPASLQSPRTSVHRPGKQSQRHASYRSAPNSPPASESPLESTFPRSTPPTPQLRRLTESDVSPFLASPPPSPSPPTRHQRPRHSSLTAVVESAVPAPPVPRAPRSHASTPPVQSGHSRQRSRTLSPPPSRLSTGPPTGQTRPTRVTSAPPRRHAFSPAPPAIAEFTPSPSPTPSPRTVASPEPIRPETPPPSSPSSDGDVRRTYLYLDMKGHPPPMVFTTKSLQLSVPYPPKVYFLPGGAVTLHLRSAANAPLASIFSSVVIKLSATSILEGGNLLHSRHLIIDQTTETSLSYLTNETETTVHFSLPDEVQCDCHRKRPSLPESTQVQFPKAARSAVEGASLRITYRAEVLLKKKGWSKGAERISFLFPVGAVLPFGIPLEFFDTRGKALDGANRLSDAEWRSTDVINFSLGAPRPSEDSNFTIQAVSVRSSSDQSSSSVFLPPSVPNAHAISAALSYWSAQVPGGIFIAWKLSLQISPRESDNLVRLLRTNALDVHLARRMCPLFTDRQGGGTGGAKPFPLDLPDDSSGIDAPTSSFVGDVVHIDVRGWFQIPQELMSLPRSCNAEIRQYLVASITTPASLEPVKLEVELHRRDAKVVVSRPKAAPPAKLSTLNGTDSSLPNPMVGIAQLSKISRRMSARSSTSNQGSTFSGPSSHESEFPETPRDGAFPRPASPTPPSIISSIGSSQEVPDPGKTNDQVGWRRLGMMGKERRSSYDRDLVARVVSAESQNSEKERRREIERKKLAALQGSGVIGFYGV